MQTPDTTLLLEGVIARSGRVELPPLPLRRLAGLSGVTRALLRLPMSNTLVVTDE
jgi:hypothetical protein